MPNHITNKLVVRGPIARVEALLKQGKVTINTPARQNFIGEDEDAKTETVDFSLRGFIPPPSSDPDYTSGGCSHSHHGVPFGQSDPNPNCWYVWNRLNWGTKWDCYDVVVKHGSDDVLDKLTQQLGDEPINEATIRFDTAWSPPMPVIKKIVELYPDLEIDFTFMDEDSTGSGGGRITYRNGKEVEAKTGLNDPNDHEFLVIAKDLKGFDYDEWKSWKEEDAKAAAEEQAKKATAQAVVAPKKDKKTKTPKKTGKKRPAKKKAAARNLKKTAKK